MPWHSGAEECRHGHTVEFASIASVISLGGRLNMLNMLLCVEPGSSAKCM